MKLTLLGTAAAEGWPAPCCDCQACATARERGGPNLRSRSGALLDDDFKIDWSADTVSQIQRLGRSLAGLRTLLFTHQHEDHIVPTELLWLRPPFSNTPPGTVHVYGNRQVLEKLETLNDSALVRHLLEPFQEVTTPDGDVILPLPAEHVTGALVPRITRGGRTIFYGHDSGLYPAATLAALGQGPKLDIALFDCTNGGVPSANRGHMGIDGVLQMIAALRANGAVHQETQLIATHFSHNGLLGHEELVAALLPHGVRVAFDGMVVRV